MEKLGTDMPDFPGFGESTQEETNVYKQKQELEIYKNIDKTNWLEPLGLFAWKHKHSQYKFYDPKTNKDWVEMHPSHWQHYKYMNEIIRPSLGLNHENNDKQVSTLNTLNKLKDENKDLLSFEKAILENVIDYKHIGYIGF